MSRTEPQATCSTTSRGDIPPDKRRQQIRGPPPALEPGTTSRARRRYAPRRSGPKNRTTREPKTTHNRPQQHVPHLPCPVSMCARRRLGLYQSTTGEDGEYAIWCPSMSSSLRKVSAAASGGGMSPLSCRQPQPRRCPAQGALYPGTSEGRSPSLGQNGSLRSAIRLCI